jgi:hypothetical protein
MLYLRILSYLVTIFQGRIATAPMRLHLFGSQCVHLSALNLLDLNQHFEIVQIQSVAFFIKHQTYENYIQTAQTIAALKQA